jgi:hypothetical protein
VYGRRMARKLTPIAGRCKIIHENFRKFPQDLIAATLRLCNAENVPLPARFSTQNRPASHSDKTHDFSALYICVSGTRVEEFLRRERDGVRHGPRNIQELRWPAVPKRSTIDECNALMSFGTRHARHRRRADTPAAATMNDMIVAGSGTAAFALPPAPLPGGWPN